MHGEDTVWEHSVVAFSAVSLAGKMEIWPYRGSPDWSIKLPFMAPPEIVSCTGACKEFSPIRKLLPNSTVVPSSNSIEGVYSPGRAS